jgi:hypothetical protein
MVYDLTIEPVKESQTADLPSVTISNGISANNTWIPNSTFYYSDWYWGTKTIYKYQLICPRCQTTNWGELDEIITCSGRTGRKFCQANLRAVSKPVDFDIPVGV